MKFWQWLLSNLAPLLMAAILVLVAVVAVGFTLAIFHLNFDRGFF